MLSPVRFSGRAFISETVQMWRMEPNSHIFMLAFAAIGESACPAFCEGVGDINMFKIFFMCTTHLKERQLSCTPLRHCIYCLFPYL